MDKILSHDRRKQVFRLLSEHGPLSKRGLQACLHPAIHLNRLTEVLARLTERRHLVKRMYRSLGKEAYYYQLSQEPKAVAYISKMTGRDKDRLDQAPFRHVQMFHSETCAIWKELLKHLFPRAQVLREHEYSAHQDISNLLLAGVDDYELRPDLMLIMKSDVINNKVALAIEIEKSPKSRARLIRKLRKYATQSRVDGVVYVCDELSLSTRLRNIYQSRIKHDALRIQNYAKNFILFTDGSLNPQKTEPVMFNADAENISIQDWMHLLLATEIRQRRDAKFQSPGF